MVPGALANMAPVLVKDFAKSLAVPVDFGKKVSGKRIFGNNKTNRGVIAGILFSLVIVSAQAF